MKALNFTYYYYNAENIFLTKWDKLTENLAENIANMGQYASHILSSWLGKIWIDASDYNLCSFSGLKNIHISTAVDGNGEIYCAAVRTIYCWLNLHILTTVFTPILEQAYFMEQALSLGAGLAVIFGAVVFWSRHIEFGAGLYWSSWHWRAWGTWLRMSDLPTCL